MKRLVIRKGKFRAEYVDRCWSVCLNRPGRRSQHVLTVSLPESVADLEALFAKMGAAPTNKVDAASRETTR